MPDTTVSQWLYVLKLVPRLWQESGWTDRDMEIVREHFSYLQGLCEKGQVLVVGRTHVELERNLGLCIFLADDEADARELMEHDPVVLNGIMTAEVYPYRIALLSDEILAQK